MRKICASLNIWLSHKERRRRVDRTVFPYRTLMEHFVGGVGSGIRSSFYPIEFWNSLFLHSTIQIPSLVLNGHNMKFSNGMQKKKKSDATRYHNGHDLARPRYLGRTDHIRHHAVQNAHPSSWWTNHVAARGAQDIPGLPVGCVLKSPRGGGRHTAPPFNVLSTRVVQMLWSSSRRHHHCAEKNFAAAL